jgi:methionine-S-sulfoxide reductase
LRVFFETHDPTSLNRQGNDVGTQYRSVILYTTDRQREKAQHSIDVLNKSAEKPIVTAVEPFQSFYLAENYHQKYYETHPDATYCQLVIDPKVDKVQTKFKHLLKE